MRLELQKLYLDRFIAALCILLFLLNIAISYYVFQDQESGKIMYTAKEYKNLYQELNEMNRQEALDWVDAELKAQAAAPDETLAFDSQAAKDLQRRQRLLSDVQTNILNCASYEQYRQSVRDRVAAAESAGLTQMEGTYSRRNKEQQLADLDTLKGTVLSYGPVKGVERFSDMTATDFLILLLSLAFVLQLVTKERESGQNLLYRTTFRGRGFLAGAKIGAVLFSVCLAALLLQGSNLVLGELLYGYGDLGRSLQSVDAYIGSRYALSIGEYLLCFFAMKLLVYSFLTLLTLFLAAKMQTAGALYFGLVLFYGVSAACYYGIPANHLWAFFKYVNGVAFLKTGDILGKYQNINIGSVPYANGTVVLAVALVGSVIFAYGFVQCFCSQKSGSVVRKNGHKINPALVNKCLLAVSRLGNGSLCGQEAYKLLVQGKAALLLCGVTVFVVLTWTPITDQFYIAKDSYYDAYVEYLKGPVTERKQEFLNREATRFEHLEQEAQKGADVSYAMQSYPAFLQIYGEKTPYLMQVQGEYLHETGYQLLTGHANADKKDIELALLAVTILIYPLSYLYGIEYQRNTIVLLHTSYYGKGKTFFCKFTVGLLLITMVYGLIYGVYYGQVLTEYGTESIFAPACSLQNLSGIPVGISLLAYLIYVAVIRYAGLILMLLFLFWASSKVRDVMGTCVSAVLVFVLPLLFAYLDLPGTQYLLLNPLLLANVW